MAIIRQVYRGTATIPAGVATLTINLPQSLLDLSKSVLYFTYRTNATANPARDGLVMGELISTTQITFSDHSGGTNPIVEIDWQVIEYFEGVTVQRGTVANVPTGGFNVSISAVNVNKSFVIVSARANAGHIGNQSQCRATITTSTNLQLWVDNNTNATVHWQVVQYDNCTVQTIQTTVSNGSLTTDVAINPVVMNRTVIFANFYTATGTLNARNWFSYYLLNSTTVRFEQQVTAAGSCLFTIQVVQFDENEARVVRFQQAVGSGDLAFNFALAELNTLYSTIFVRGLYDTCGAINYNNDTVERSAFETNITSSIQAFSTRAASGSAGTVSFEILEKIIPPQAWHIRGTDRGIGRKQQW